MGKPESDAPAPGDESKKRLKRKRENHDQEAPLKVGGAEEHSETKSNGHISEVKGHKKKKNKIPQLESEDATFLGQQIVPLVKGHKKKKNKIPQLESEDATFLGQQIVPLVKGHKKKKNKIPQLESEDATFLGQQIVPLVNGHKKKKKKEPQLESADATFLEQQIVPECLLHVKPLMAYLLRKTFGEECPSIEANWCLLCGLRRHGLCSRRIATKYPYPLPPLEIVDNVRRLINSAALGDDQDASEFMSDAIKKMELDFLCKHNKVGELNLIQHIFSLQLYSKITCQACKASSLNFYPMQILSVEIDDSFSTIEDCLGGFTKPEILEVERNCTKCNETVKPEKQLFIREPPNILAITLNRFTAHGKLDKIIKYSMELDLNPFMHRVNGENIYDLYAIVIHEGRDTSCGHYTCYVKDFVGNWSLYDDMKVVPKNVGDVLEKKPYMLLYVRRTIRLDAISAEIGYKQEEGQVAEIEHLSSHRQDDMKSAACLLTRQTDKHKKGEVRFVKEGVAPKIFNLARNLGTRMGQAEQQIFRDRYLIAEDIDRDAVLEKIKSALKFYKATKKFYLPIRGKDSVVFDTDVDFLCQKDKGLYKTKSLSKEKRIAMVLKAVKHYLEAGMLIQERSIYYMNTKLFDHDHTKVKNIVTAVCSMFGCTRTSLNVTVSAVGSIAGPVILHINRNVFINCWNCGVSGTKIPDEAHHIHTVEEIEKVSFILIVEKDTVFKVLTELEVHRNYNCIIISGSGQPDEATRAVVWKLRQVLQVPVYGFVDANAHGVQILCTYKFGSQSKAFNNLNIAVPELEWIGLYPSDLISTPGLCPLSAREETMLSNLLHLGYVNNDPSWNDRLSSMLYSGLTGDIEQVLSYMNIEYYLCQRIPIMQELLAQRQLHLKKHKVASTDDEIEDYSSKPTLRSNPRSTFDSGRAEKDALAKEQDLPYLAKNETKKENGNVRKRKCDTFTHDPATPMDKTKLSGSLVRVDKTGDKQKRNPSRTDWPPPNSIFASSSEDENFVFEAKETTGQGFKKIKPENVTSMDETKKERRQVGKRKKDTIYHDLASRMDKINVIESSVTKQEAELKKKSKKRKRMPLEAEDGKQPNNIRTLENGLVIEDLSAGNQDTRVALNGSKVHIHYVGKLQDGKIIHSNVSGKPYKFILGAEKLIPGWNFGIEGMHVGGKRRLTIPPSLCANGGNPVGEAPKNSTIVYNVELVKVQSKAS